MVFKVITLALVFWVASLAHADSPLPPSSYKVVSENQQYVFVMIAPDTLEREVRQWVQSKAQEILAIRSDYAQSGMYRNDGSKQLLWVVDWYAWGVQIANDGIHLVRPGPWAQSRDDEAVSFFANGKLLKTYTIKQLVKNRFKLQRTVSHFFWETDSLFDREKMRYYIATLDNRHYIFDVRTGDIKYPAI